MFERVTDPKILSQLGLSNEPNENNFEKVTDPNILKQIKDKQEKEQKIEQFKKVMDYGKAGETSGIVASDIGNAALNVPSALAGALSGTLNIATHLPDIKNQITNDPKRAFKNIMAGGGEMLSDVSRIPPALMQYLAHIKMLPPEVAQFMPKPFSEEETSQAMNKFVGEGEKPGDELRGVIRNIPNIVGAGKAAQILNPLKLTSKNIAKNVLKTEKDMIDKYSGKNGLYSQLQDEAHSRGVIGNHINPSQKDINILKKDMPTDEFVAIEKLLDETSIRNAQNAISQLGHRERKLQGKSNRGDILTDPEKDLLKAVKNTKEHIEKNMFKDVFGKMHDDLFEKHQGIQKGYATEVIPYTKNPNINAFKKNELSAREMVDRLSRGKFSAKRGKEHPSMKYRKIAKDLLGNKIAKYGIGGTALGAGGTLGYSLMNKLLGQD